MFILLKVDKIMASTLPIGKYLLLSMPKVTVIIVLSWILSVSVSILVNTFYPCSYEPAVVLCILILPIGFFITVFSCFCVIFIVIIVGFIISILYLKKVGLHELHFKTFKYKISNFLWTWMSNHLLQMQAEMHNHTGAVSNVDYKTLETNAKRTFLVTLSHVL